jgi:hypothetical protein
MSFRKVVAGLLAVALILGQGVFAYGEESTLPSPSKVLAYHKPNVTLLYNEQELGFTDVNGTPVYPIIYGGTTYIPVRGVSELMGENIEWEAKNQIVFVGKTISMPYKGTTGMVEPELKPVVPLGSRPGQTIITVYLKPDVKIMYDFELQAFQDVNGKRVYPIIYGGTTYLPIRAISGLMGASIEWNSSTQTISIHRDVPTPVEERSAATVAMTDLFNQAVELYNQSTAKISVLQSTQDPLQLQAMADGVSIDYEVAKANTALGKEIKNEDFSPQELLAHEKLTSFLELAEYYTLVLENIFFMAVSGQDYSMFAETFLIFALESESKMDEARAAIEAL